jgi:hypothetical protein
VSGPRRIGNEHQPFAAEDGVIGRIGLLDALEVELAHAHVSEPEGASPRGSDRRHPRGHVGEDHLAIGRDQLGGRQAGSSRAACQLEHALAGVGLGQLEHPLCDRGAAGVDVVRVLAPRLGHVRPHPMEARPQLIRLFDHAVRVHDRLLDVEYTLTVMNSPVRY